MGTKGLLFSSPLRSYHRRMGKRAVHIAIVDDEDSVRKALLRLFRLAKYRAEAFASGGDFLESLSRRIPDCVVLDIQMPGMAGLELLEHLSRMAYPPPVIVITADPTQRTRDECRALGTKHYLRKPVESAILLGFVRETVGCSPE